MTSWQLVALMVLGAALACWGLRRAMRDTDRAMRDLARFGNLRCNRCGLRVLDPAVHDRYCEDTA